jgi:hypothetical protein
MFIGSIPLAIANNEVDFTLSHEFTYFSSIMKVSFTPHFASSNGGSQITVKILEGSVLASDVLMCRFGEQIVDAVFVNSSTLLCTAPKQPIGSVTIALTKNGIDFVPCSMTLSYVKDPTFVSVTPSYGPTKGGQQVFISGINLRNISGSCIFGAAPSVRLQYLNSTVAVCLTPPQSSVSALVRVKYEYLERFLLIGGGEKYNFEDVPYIAQIYPTFGSELGGTNVRVMGVHFRHSESLVCSFEMGEVLSLSPGFWVSNTIIECLTPKMHQGTALLSVSNNKQDFCVSVEFVFLTPLHIDELYPASGPSDGGSSVIVRTKRIDKWHEITCKFDSLEVIGTKLNATAILCLTPRHSTGIVDLSILTSHGYESTNSLPFRYVQAPRVVSFFPKCGPITGNTRLTIVGSGFHSQGVNAIKCRFFGESVSTAIVQNDSTIVCLTPQANYTIDTEVEITVNNFEYIPSTFLYITIMK